MTRLLNRFALSLLALLSLVQLAIAQGATVVDSQYVGAAEPKTAPDVYGQGVRETPWQSPDDEAAGFHLPPGFAINAYASEPMIAKPLNMAWDQSGRLWVTSTVEYPYPAEDTSQARDQVLILEDTDGDGRADKSTVFADGLNIPMGILPMHDGAIVFNIPNLVYMRDTDGDDRVDQKEVLFGPFDTTRDTHGMINSLRRGDDGWIYACHGFNNQSTITDRNGHQIQMHSGNTFRFTPDGQHVQLYSRGQVNPFGLTRDEWGNWFSADCHSKPITALLRGGCYPSFGRPHDGLGFAPEMMKHLHGSTAISGLSYYQSSPSQISRFPSAYRRKLYSGNVMTSRINCNALGRNGATATAIEQPDFLTSDDPWFRPVDIQVGPDGALYVCDFYNKIIGHYEVPLTHPGRDRASGRIWRITYSGPATQSTITPSTASQTLSLSDAFQTEDAIAIARAVRIAANRPPDGADSQMQDYLPQVKRLLAHTEPQGALAAIEFLGRYGDAGSPAALLQVAVTSEDRTLIHAARIAARDLLRDEEKLAIVERLLLTSESNEQAKIRAAFVGILPGLQSEAAAESLLSYASSLKRPQSRSDTLLLISALELSEQFAATVDTQAWRRVVETFCQGGTDNEVDYLSRLVTNANAQGGFTLKQSHVLHQFRRKLLSQSIGELVAEIDQNGPPQTWRSSTGADWPVQERLRTDKQPIELWSSFPLGERYVGSSQSERFSCPESFSFWVAGHNGHPQEVQHNKNFIRLVDASGTELQRASPPRNDVAHRVVWDLKEHAGKQTRLQVVDGDNTGAYAWLAVGEFSIAGLNPSRARDSLTDMITLLGVELETPIEAQQMNDLRDDVLGRLSNDQQNALLSAILATQNHSVAQALVQFASKKDLSSLIPPAWMQLNAPEAESTVIFASQVFRSVDALSQRELSAQLIPSASGCRLLAVLLDRGLIGSVAFGTRPELLPRGLTQGETQSLEAAFKSGVNAEALRARVAQRFTRLPLESADLGTGKLVFEKNCANCHQLGGKGALVGPQLDGAVKRSKQRLAEDVLAPNLNVDAAFRTTSLLLDDDSVVAGLIANETDAVVTLVKSDGKPVAVQKAAIVERKQSTESLMPVGLADQLTDAELAALLEYLTRYQP